MLQPYQAYLKLHNSKIKSTVEKVYREKLQAVRKGDKLPSRLEIMVDIAKESLVNESEKVKEEVEQYRLHGEVDDDVDDKEQARKRY